MIIQRLLFVSHLIYQNRQFNSNQYGIHTLYSTQISANLSYLELIAFLIAVDALCAMEIHCKQIMLTRLECHSLLVLTFYQQLSEMGTRN